MAKMSAEERARYDAQARKEAWEFALSILIPWVDTTHAIGSPELTHVMEGALEEARRELDRATDDLAPME